MNARYVCSASIEGNDNYNATALPGAGYPLRQSLQRLARRRRLHLQRATMAAVDVNEEERRTIPIEEALDFRRSLSLAGGAV